MKSRRIGKSIGDTLYIHLSAEEELTSTQVEMVNHAKTLLPPTFFYNILKIRTNKREVSFIESPDFDITDEPLVGDSYKVQLDSGIITFSKGRKQNQQIYHHKWMLVKDDYHGFDVEASKRRSAEWETLSETFPIDKKKIGNSDYWRRVTEEIQKRRGWFQYAFPIPFTEKWERGISWERALSLQPSLFNGTTLIKDKQYTHHPTQVRNTVLTYKKVFEHLAQQLEYQGRSHPSYSILDASSGLGLGTQLGREMGFLIEDIEMYPPLNYKPKYRHYDEINTEYDCIICNMVLNIIPQDKRDELVRTLTLLLKPNGILYFMVRGRKEIEKQPSGIPFTPMTPVSRTDKFGEYFFPSKRSYQKGFYKEELLAYITDTLASEQVKFEVKPLTVANAGLKNAVGVVVTKQAMLESAHKI